MHDIELNTFQKKKNVGLVMPIDKRPNRMVRTHVTSTDKSYPYTSSLSQCHTYASSPTCASSLPNERYQPRMLVAHMYASSHHSHYPSSLIARSPTYTNKMHDSSPTYASSIDALRPQHYTSHTWDAHAAYLTKYSMTIERRPA